MSSPDIIRRYALRVDVFDGLKDRLSQWLSSVANGFIVSFETTIGQNDHVHCIVDCHKSIKVIRSSFCRAFPESVGNKSYSLKLCDDEYLAYVRYICKGKDKETDPVIWIRQGLLYRDEDIKDAHEKYWVNNAAIEENRTKRKAVDGNLVEQLERICKKKGVRAMDRQRVAEEYIKLFRDARKGINVYAARAIVNTVCLCLEGGDAELSRLSFKIADL